jgi:hypothetical protein|tara:strand:- start:4089 stop:5309 length:1221 start_codon:yes stop_codon:yes gene_type:complete
MEAFAEFITENKNTHMTHIEDKVLYGGVDGTRQSINALRDLRDLLAGHGAGKVSVKWDGAPAVFCGTDPSDGKFFVAKKGIFNKNPMVYKTDADIDADTSGDLNAKLKEALLYLPALGIVGVIQGDFLFGKGDVSTKTIEGQKYTVFHPNTIAYAVPYDQAKSVRDAKIGIVWHTTYKGATFESMTASYGVDVSKLTKSKHVWSQDAMLRDATKATMSDKDTVEVNARLTEIGRLFKQTSAKTLKTLEASPKLAQAIETYNNSFVRAGALLPDSKRHVSGLISNRQAYYKKEIDSKKSERGKETWRQKYADEMEFFSAKNRANLVKMFELQKLIVLVKLKLINSLDKLKTIDTFVKTSKGYKVTGEEGYVAIDTLGGDAVKLVDRMEFSYNNFSSDILKGWDSARK